MGRKRIVPIYGLDTRIGGPYQMVARKIKGICHWFCECLFWLWPGSGILRNLGGIFLVSGVWMEGKFQRSAPVPAGCAGAIPVDCKIDTAKKPVFGTMKKMTRRKLLRNNKYRWPFLQRARYTPTNIF